MKLYNRSHFAVRHAASKDPTRFNLCGVRFKEDGSTEATDGHILARVSSETPSAEEFPHVEIASTDEPLKSFILPLGAANEVAKSIPRRQSMPILEHAALDVVGVNSGDSVRFVTTDLETKKPLEARKVEGDYPNTDQIMPPMMEPAFVLDALLVERACKIAREFRGGNAKQSPVRLQFFPGKKTGLDALGIRVEDPDVGELKIVIMPMRP